MLQLTKANPETQDRGGVVICDFHLPASFVLLSKSWADSKCKTPTQTHTAIH